MVWKPHVTVSAVAEKDGKFLLVEEKVKGRVVFNNPAGHLEDGETLLDAVVRETMEETACDFRPEAITGIYLWKSPADGRTFLRVNFFGQCMNHDSGRKLDAGILRAVWLSRTELLRHSDKLRSPMVMRCIDDYLAGARYPLNVLTYLESGAGLQDE